MDGYVQSPNSIERVLEEGILIEEKWIKVCTSHSV